MNKVLIVEDGLITALHLEKLLETNGFEVIGKLKSGEEVEETVEELMPDLIVLDIMLADKMTGVESAQKIREFCDIPILFVSALTDSGTLVDVSHISNSIRISKPFDDEELIEELKEFLDKQ